MPNDESFNTTKEADTGSIDNESNHEPISEITADSAQEDSKADSIHVSDQNTDAIKPAESTPLALTKQDAPSINKAANTPGVLILQWLTYAFWGWTLIALYWLTALAVQYFIQSPSSSDSYGYSASYIGDSLAYSLAAVIVLFIISIICDIFYSRSEPARKTGAAMVIMIIHAVIFALCGIGSLIVAVFAIVNMLISGGGEAAVTTLITAASMSLLYAATLVRVLNPQKIKHITKIYWAVMIVATIVIASLGIIGPAAYTQRTKADTALESAVSDVADAVNDYTTKNEKLPASLKNSEIMSSYYVNSEDTKSLIEKGLVKYTPGEEVTSTTDRMTEPSLYENTRAPIYHYKLCVTYDNEKKATYAADIHYPDSNQKYDIRPDTSSHAAGEVCYDLQTDYTY